MSFVGTLSWHPGGQYIAIASNRGNDAPLWMLDLQTMQLKEIWYGEAGFQQVRWSPDGKWLFWQSGDLTSLLSFSEENFTQPAIIQRLPSSLRSRANPWLPGSNFVGLLSDSLDFSPAEFCLYSILGEQVGCPFKIDGVVNELGIDESPLSIAITWTP